MKREMFLKNLSGAFLILFSSLLASTVSAQEYHCTFNSWKGSHNQDDETTISWLGTGFSAQIISQEVGRIQIERGSQAGDWVSTTVRQTGSFTTFKFTFDGRTSSGKTVKMRYGYRVYDTGKCSGIATPKGYRPMQAEGFLD